MLTRQYKNLVLLDFSQVCFSWESSTLEYRLYINLLWVGSTKLDLLRPINWQAWIQSVHGPLYGHPILVGRSPCSFDNPPAHVLSLSVQDSGSQPGAILVLKTFSWPGFVLSFFTYFISFIPYREVGVIIYNLQLRLLRLTPHVSREPRFRVGFVTQLVIEACC